MDIKRYFNNIKALSKSLGLPSEIELDGTLGATIVSNDLPPIMVHISYDFDKNQMELRSLVTAYLPRSRVGMQHIMNQLVGDLFAQQGQVGRLVADTKNACMYFVSSIPVENASDETLATFFPIFLKKCREWRLKLEQNLGRSNKTTTQKDTEILSFGAL